MTPARILIAILCVAAAGCSGREETQAPAAAVTPTITQVSAPAPAPQAAQDDAPPACTNARAHELVKEAFVRRVIVSGDQALMERGALEAADAFTEEEIVRGLPRAQALGRLEDVAEVDYDAANKVRRCSARLAVQGWADLRPPVSYRIVSVPDASRFGVESSVVLMAGAEGFNMVQGYRSTFGKAIRD